MRGARPGTVVNPRIVWSLRAGRRIATSGGRMGLSLPLPATPAPTRYDERWRRFDREVPFAGASRDDEAEPDSRWDLCHHGDVGLVDFAGRQADVFLVKPRSGRRV